MPRLTSNGTLQAVLHLNLAPVRVKKLDLPLDFYSMLTRVFQTTQDDVLWIDFTIVEQVRGNTVETVRVFLHIWPILTSVVLIQLPACSQSAVSILTSNLRPRHGR